LGPTKIRIKIRPTKIRNAPMLTNSGLREGVKGDHQKDVTFGLVIEDLIENKQAISE